ncbi:hypothetical protein GQ55_2G244800 [Panicum hallii var. hallii]|uniref:Uncharacterized protein n=1 Tax=Panicum hallii var. hallii TaxID=1504633 RepID=A0A2T7ES09_9POAL|nr:hypothetical protein GQ55_2G244800 [Panicum hallii var. hallii]
MLELRHLIRAPVCHALRRGGGHVDAPCRTDDLAACLGPPVPPDSCFVEGRILGARVECGGPPAPPEVTAYCPVHGWTSYFHDEGGPSAAAPHAYGIASPRQSPSPARSSSPSYSPETPPYTPTPAEERYGCVTPLGEPRGTMAARHGVPPYYNDATSSSAAAPVLYSKPELAPPPSPPAPIPA